MFIGHDAHHQILLTALLDSDPGPVAQLRSLITAHVSSYYRYPDLAIVSNYERHVSPEAYAPAAALRERSAQLLVEVVARGREMGVFDVLDDTTTLGAIAAFGLSALNWYPSYAGELTPDDVGASCAELALRMLGA